MKSTAKNNSKMIGLGAHLVTLLLVALDTAKQSPLYKDLTQQIVITFENAKKQTIKRWYNLKGFKRYPENPTRIDEITGESVPNYFVGKDGKRVEDKERTAAAIGIIDRLAFDLGYAEGDDYDTVDFVGKQCGIFVSAKGSSKNVHYSMPVSEIPATEVEEAEEAERGRIY